MSKEPLIHIGAEELRRAKPMSEPTQEQIKEFCLRVNAWNEAEVPVSLGDLRGLAIELGTPVPHFDRDLNLVWD